MLNHRSNVLISVITPVFNAARFLPRLVRCVQEQHGANYEHIIVDDSSTDDSWVLLNALASSDARIRLIRLEINGGVVEARNVAISHARGRYLAFLDADDLWLPDKLVTQSTFMHEQQAALTFTDYRFISEDGKKIGLLLRGPHEIGWSIHHMTRYLGCLTIMLDRERIPNFSFGDVSADFRAEDFLAWSNVILHKGPARRCPHDLARYAVVSNSRSSSGSRAAKSVWRLYREIELISFFSSLFYFATYALFSTVKRFYCRPVFPRAFIDKPPFMDRL